MTTIQNAVRGEEVWSDDDEEEGVQCDECGSPISFANNWYHCEECADSFDLCEPCYFEEEGGHEHPMVRQLARPEARALFEVIDESSRNKVLLGAFASALPHSRVLRKNKVKNVLSALYFDHTKPMEKVEFNRHEPTVEMMMSLFYPNGKYSPVVQVNGITYYHLNMPDVRDPVQMQTFSGAVRTPLLRGAMFIHNAVKKGNVLVHCEMGQRRSPTLLMAWMIAVQDFSVDDTIDRIDAKHRVQSDWGEGYRRHRTGWIEELLTPWHRRKSKFKGRVEQFHREHKRLVEWWDDVPDNARTRIKRVSTEEYRRRQEQQQEEQPVRTSTNAAARGKRLRPASVVVEEDDEEEEQPIRHTPKRRKVVVDSDEDE